MLRSSPPPCNDVNYNRVCFLCYHRRLHRNPQRASLTPQMPYLPSGNNLSLSITFHHLKENASPLLLLPSSHPILPLQSATNLVSWSRSTTVKFPSISPSWSTSKMTANPRSTTLSRAKSLPSRPAVRFGPVNPCQIANCPLNEAGIHHNIGIYRHKNQPQRRKSVPILFG